jgi:agmatinase
MAQTPPFGGGDARPTDFDQARVVLLPVPYEGTVSYGAGASQGPRAILEASAQLEMYDEELDWSIDEVGLFTLPPVNVEGLTPEEVMRAIHDAALAPLRSGKLLCTLGGEHSISYGVFTALQELRGGPFSILQIDAHADLRPSYDGTPHSHACIMARAHDLQLPFVQVGLRSCSADEREFLRANGLERNVFWAWRIAAARDDEGWIDEVLERLAGDVYITVDVDGLDPSLMPSTGTPEPGGLDWHTLLRLLRRVTDERNVIGMDLTELAPVPGLHAPDYTAARLVYKMIGYALHREWRQGAPSG